MKLFSNRSRWYNQNLKRSINNTFTTIRTHAYLNNQN